MNFFAITLAAGSCRPGQPFRADRAGRCHGQTQAQPPRNMVACLGQIIGQVLADRLGTLQGRQHIDETEELNANQRVVQRPGDEPFLPPGGCQGLVPRPIRSNSSRPISLVRRSRASEACNSACSAGPRATMIALARTVIAVRARFGPDAVANLPAPFL